MQVETHCKIGRVRWKRHSTATQLPGKALQTRQRLEATIIALSDTKRREAIEKAAKGRGGK
jgi:hypothetical protein